MGNIHLEGEMRDRPKIGVYSHRSSNSSFAETIIRDLYDHGFDVVNKITSCLCEQHINDLDFEGQEVVLLNTLNGGTVDGLEESKACNRAVKDIVEKNPGIHFYLVDLGDEDFREEVLGKNGNPENLTYIRYGGFGMKLKHEGSTLEDFTEEARCLHQ